MELVVVCGKLVGFEWVVVIVVVGPKVELVELTVKTAMELIGGDWSCLEGKNPGRSSCW
jgi:hypothetical protein